MVSTKNYSASIVENYSTIAENYSTVVENHSTSVAEVTKNSSSITTKPIIQSSSERTKRPSDHLIKETKKLLYDFHTPVPNDLDTILKGFSTVAELEHWRKKYIMDHLNKLVDETQLFSLDSKKGRKYVNIKGEERQ